MGRGPELFQKLNSERRAGLYLADMWLNGGAVPLTELKPKGILDPIPPIFLLPEVTDSKLWWGNKIHFADKEGKYVLSALLYPNAPMFINTEAARPDEVRSYKNLLEPKWKGKIVMGNPTMPGVAGRWFAVVSTKLMDVEFMRQFAKQDPVIVNDERLGVEGVARGKYYIGLALLPDPVAEFQKMGAPIKWAMPVEGTDLLGGPGIISLINNAAHPNAVKVFINWFLSKEGQTIYSRANLLQSGRVDVPVDHISPEMLRSSGVSYFISENEDFIANTYPEYLKLAKEIFAAQLK